MNPKFASGYNAAVAAFVAGWILFALPWLSGSVTVPYDAKAHFQPQLQFLANALHTGQSPFWTHNVFGGSPQVADPQSLIFSPVILLAYLEPAPSFRQLDLYCFSLLAVAGLSVLFFFKDRGWHPAGATVAALATAFGGSSVWRIQHIKQIESFAFFMLTLWLLARALDRKGVSSGILAGLAACMMVIEPGQVALLGCYVLIGYTLNYWLSQPRFWISVRQTLPALLSGGLVATVLAAGPILFSFLFVLDSNRPEIPFNEAVRGSLHYASLLTAIVPNLYSVKGDAPYWGPGSLEWPANWLSMSENMGQIYIGTLPALLLLSLGLVKGRLWSAESRFFSLALATLLIYALGRYTYFFSPLFHYLPGVDLFRRPADATYALGAVASMASGYFLHLILMGQESLTPKRSYAVLAIVGCLILTSIGVAAAYGHLSLASQPLLLSTGLFAAGWFVLLFARRYAERYSFATIALLTAFMTLDLSIGNGASRSTAQPPAKYDELRADTKNDMIAFLRTHLAALPNSVRRDRAEMVGLGFEWPNLSLIHNFDHDLGYNPVRLGAIAEGMGASETVAEAWQRRFTPLFPSYRSLMADMLGLRYIATRQPIETIDKKLKPGDLRLAARSSGGYVYENPRALPRVIFATDWMAADFDSILANGRWPGFDPMRTVLLNAIPPQRPPFPAFQGLPVSLSNPAILLRTYHNTEIQIEVISPRAGFVVLNDIWHPWWFGSIDGKPAEILHANVLFRAIQVPAGQHIVRFEFKPLEGAMKELAARMHGKQPAEKMLPPGDGHVRPEASVQGTSRIAGITTGTLR
jgi:hypothetical protein